jgi:hypothetical protein
MGVPDEPIPTLTWFSKDKEQRAIREAYQEKYEKKIAKLNEISRYLEERILKLGAKRTSAEGRFPSDQGSRQGGG